MIAVEIPAALAEHPEVVPVDACAQCKGSGEWVDLEVGPGAMRTCGACLAPMSSLVGQRVALAWRKTCPTCNGRGKRSVFDSYHQDGWIDQACPDCTNGERMVVGWTAEVAEVMPIVTGSTRDVPTPFVRRTDIGTAMERLWIVRARGEAVDRSDLLPLADWSPGRYALVLRDVQMFGEIVNGELVSPIPCDSFNGFAELSEVLR